MSTQTDVVPDDAAGGELPAAPEGLAEQLVAQAREQGIALTGPGGLLTGLTKQVLETALDAEMTASRFAGGGTSRPSKPGGFNRSRQHLD